MQTELNRRSFLGRSAAMFGANFLPVDASSEATSSKAHEKNATGILNHFAEAYMKMMHAPGMAVGLLSNGKASSHVYGFSEVGARLPVKAEQPFWIGSICKSFVGLVAMQIRDEGKLDLHKPVLEIMPDLPFTNEFSPITAHHLLTHTWGLPNWLQLFSSDPSQRAEQAYPPGNRFAYCNLGYDTLGLLIAHLDGRSWPEAVTARILNPLEMDGASGQINDAVQARMPTGYHFQYRDRPCTVADPLVPVGYLLMSNVAGCIAATSGDMSKYMRMLAQRGRGPSGRILSEEGFQLIKNSHGSTRLRSLSPNIFSAASDATLSGNGAAQGPSQFALIFGVNYEGKASELSYGPHWYAGEQFHGAPFPPRMNKAERYQGVYTSDSPWMDPLRVVERNGKLWLDGVEELAPKGIDRFSPEGGEGALDFEFLSFLDGRAEMLRVGGDVLRRVALIPLASGSGH